MEKPDVFEINPEEIKILKNKGLRGATEQISSDLADLTARKTSKSIEEKKEIPEVKKEATKKETGETAEKSFPEKINPENPLKSVYWEQNPSPSERKKFEESVREKKSEVKTESLIKKIIKFLLGKKEEAKKQKELAEKLGVKDESITPEIGKETEGLKAGAERAMETYLQVNKDFINKLEQENKKEKGKLSPEKQGLFDKIKGLDNKKKIQLALGIALVAGSVFAGGLPILTGMTIGQLLFGKAILVGTEAALAGTAAGYAGIGLGGILLEKLFRKSEEEPGKPGKPEETTKAPEKAPEPGKTPGTTETPKPEEIGEKEAAAAPAGAMASQGEKPIRTDIDILEDLGNLSEEEKAAILEARTKAGIQTSENFNTEKDEFGRERILEKERVSEEKTTEERIIEETKNRAGNIGGRKEEKRDKFFSGEDDLDAPRT
ncbi:MAG: hypothetical protein Q8O39_01690 [bacterium]|nr:hypothetical protein [bacterium]